jgi:hypothetical protein
MVSWWKTTRGEYVCELAIVVQVRGTEWHVYPFGGRRRGPYLSLEEARDSVEHDGKGPIVAPAAVAEGR